MLSYFLILFHLYSNYQQLKNLEPLFMSNSTEKLHSIYYQKQAVYRISHSEIYSWTMLQPILIASMSL